MTTQKNKNIVLHPTIVTRKLREKQGGHRSLLLWFTGLSGAGKSTLAHAVEKELYWLGCKTIVLDGDNVRHGLCDDLGFSDGERIENLRRIGEVAKLFVEAGLITLTAVISPFRSSRNWVRNLMPPGDFVEIYCKCPIDVCETRDVKDLYKRARAGDIPDFTGINSPYEEPEEPELLINTDNQSLEDSVEVVIRFLEKLDIFSEKHAPKTK